MNRTTACLLLTLATAWTTAGAQTAAAPPDLPARTTRRVFLINRPGSVQSNIVFGNLAIRRDDPDYYALSIANTILGGGVGSRLFNSVRERLGYAYDVHSSVSPHMLAGDFTQSAQTRTAVTASALQEMLKEEADLRTGQVTDAELRDAKAYINGTFVLSLTSQAGLADRLLSVAVYHLPADYLETFRDKINAVTAADIQQVAQKYMQPDQEAIVVVGDAEKLRDSLQPIGEIEEVK